MTPLKLGVTGGIGSGKSLVCQLLRGMKVPVYIADDEAKRLMSEDPDVRRQLIALVGASVFVGDALNKALLAEYLFAKATHTARVNAIVHPAVRDDFRRWTINHADVGVVAIESAILFEAGFADEVDVRWLVYAPRELRITRTMRRSNMSRYRVEQRMSSQMDDQSKVPLCDAVIVNDGRKPLIPQVERFYHSLIAP
jgi:dephospho-CoA kinase